MPPERRNGRQRATRYELSLIPRIRDRKIQVSHRWHVEHRRLDGLESRHYIPVKLRVSPDIMLFPGPHLQDQIVGIGSGNEIVPKVIHDLVEGVPETLIRAPQLLAPPFL